MAAKDVIIIGAGPYGLSAVAHLRHLGLDPYLIGVPMGFWKAQMPGGMYLRSGLEASNISSPKGSLSIEAHERATRRLSEPIPISDFIGYAQWFQEKAVPKVDTRPVRTLAHNDGRFTVGLQDGDNIESRAVVLALGIGQFAQRPTQFQDLPSQLAPHSSDLSDLSRFAGKRVAVLGSGQSALEYAALLREQRAEVQIITRSTSLRYLKPGWRGPLLRRLTPGPMRPLSHWLRPPTDLGDMWTSRIIANPAKFRRQSLEVQQTLLDAVKKPIGSHWLRPRLEGILVRTGVSVRSAERVGEQVRLVLDNDVTELLDCVVLATGYKIDVSRYPMLDQSIKRSIRVKDGYPVMTTGLETSLPGLYMTGVVGERTLGPTLRFVTGTSNASPRLADAIARSLTRKR